MHTLLRRFYKISQVGLLGIALTGLALIQGAPNPARAAVSDPTKLFYDTGILEQGPIRLKFSVEKAKRLNQPMLFIGTLNKLYQIYSEQVGGSPYFGNTIEVVEKCPQSAPVDQTCPYGRVINDAYWAYAGQETVLSEQATETLIQDFNNGILTFGIAHECGHNFDQIAPLRSGYLFGTTAVEAWANLKVVYALDKIGLPISLAGHTYSTSEDLLKNFYLPFYSEYVSRPDLNFYSLHTTENPVVGKLADYYLAILAEKISTPSDREALFRTLSIYNARSYAVSRSNLAPDEKMNAFVLTWSLLARRDLGPLFLKDRYPIFDQTARQIQDLLRVIQQMNPPLLARSARELDWIAIQLNSFIDTLPTQIIKNKNGTLAKKRGGLDLDWECRRLYGSMAKSDLNTTEKTRFGDQAAFKWRCIKNQQYLNLNIATACKSHYAFADIFAAYTNLHDGYSWKCYTPQ